jgi:hypothetical protein
MFGLFFLPGLCIFFCFLACTNVQCDTNDDDTLLEFYWDAASGDVHHYNVYLSIDEASYFLAGTTTTAPTEENPYAVPVEAEDGRTYRLEVQAEDAHGATGPMSEPSDLVWCKLRSPGDMNGETVGDIDGDLRVDQVDQAILAAAWGKRRGDVAFDYKADLNYDASVDILDLLDLIVMASSWGNTYESRGG